MRFCQVLRDIKQMWDVGYEMWEVELTGQPVYIPRSHITIWIYFGFRFLFVSILDEVIHKGLAHRWSGALVVSDQIEMAGKRKPFNGDVT